MKKLLMVGLVLIVVIGAIAGPAVAFGKEQPAPQSAVAQKAAFQDDMRKLWEDHIIWTRQVIVDVFAANVTSPSLPDLSVALTRLLANQDDIGNAIKPFYGNAAGNQLTALLKIHINTAGEILFALKLGNNTALNNALTAWYANANDIAVFLNAANPKNWPLDETKAMMKHHLDLTKTEALARFQGRWADDVAAFDEVHMQILMMADFLSNGIIAQFPQKFTEGFSGKEVNGRFNQPGNILISDQFNNRVIEINRAGEIIWQFGIGPNDQTASSIIGVNDAQRVGDLTLMAGTGVPPANPPLEPGAINGIPDNRVILVNKSGEMVWQYGQFGVTGSGPNQLNTPVQNTWLPNGHVLITDQGNQRIIEVDHNKNIVWQYGTTGVSGNGSNQLNNPNSAELLANGHILIADENNNRAIEVTHDNSQLIVASFTAGGTVSGCAFASRLRNGNTLLTDSNNSRIVEVNGQDQVVWQYFTNTDPNSNPAPLPTRAIRLRNGNTIISDQFNDRVIIIDHSKTPKIIATYGNLNQPGFGLINTNQGLNAPYDAKVIGDYTGITPPSGFPGEERGD